jgi:hypothetical protein
LQLSKLKKSGVEDLLLYGSLEGISVVHVQCNAQRIIDANIRQVPIKR